MDHMSMSLDDYIKTMKVSNQNKNQCETSFKTKRGHGNEDEEVENSGNDIWKGPDADTEYLDLDTKDDLGLACTSNAFESVKPQTYRKEMKRTQMYNYSFGNKSSSIFDLREKISGNKMPHAQSQQWRLMYPNNQRPIGMAPLIPMDAPQRQWRQRRKWCNNNGGGYQFGGVSNNNNVARGSNDGRIQRPNHQRNHQNVLNKGLKTVLGRFNENNTTAYKTANDFYIECDSHSISLDSTGPLAQQNYALQPMLMPSRQHNELNISQDGLNNAPENRSIMLPLSQQDNLSLGEILGVPSKATPENLSMLTSKILQFLENKTEQTVHKPIYDMKIQKDIHDLQKKTLAYKCPGGQVISNDGVGVNCEIIPRSSGVSMNYRFA